MTTILEIPEWTGSSLTVASFTNYVRSVYDAFDGKFEQLALQTIAPELQNAVGRLTEFVNRQRAFDETPELAKADSNRDALWKALYHAWHYAMQLDPEHALYKAALTLKSEMSAYKGVWKHEITKETLELQGLRRDLDCVANSEALSALGLTNLAAALFAANDAVAEITAQRDQTRGERIGEKGADSTAALRKTVANLLIEAYRQVNAAARINPSITVENAIKEVNGIIAHYKDVAAQPAKRKGGDEPEPEPDPEAAAS